MEATRRSVVQWLRTQLEPYRADEPRAGFFRARQLQAVLRLTPLMMVANALNGAFVLVTYWDLAPSGLLVVWSLALAAIVGRGTRGWVRSRRAGPRAFASSRGLRRTAINASLLALLWGLAPLVLFPISDGPRQLLMATMTTGMMCAGGFALATTPIAGTLYVLILGTCASVAVFRAHFPLAFALGSLLVIYTVIVLAAVWTTARLFAARLLAEADAERHIEVIGLLLRDFEEHASDVLWEIDAEGRFCHVSPRLVSLFGVPADLLSSAPALDLLGQLMPNDTEDQLDTLRTHLQGTAPFSDLPLALTRDGRTRWWSLTAKPLTDATGRPTGWRGVATDITDAHRANRQLTWLAHFDPLTNLANRHQFRTHLAELLDPPTGAPQPFAVLCLDLDHFKTINDTLGHAIGDGLLQEVAQRLLSRTRRSDTVARLGGDEFAVILRDVSSPDEAGHLTRRLLDGLESPCDVQGTRIVVQTSIGVALAPRDGTDIDALLNHADLALYAAKSAGRGEFRFFAPQMAAQTRRRLNIEQALRDAGARHELTLAFQPIVDFATWQVTGFEALLRWHHPEFGEVPPSEFVPVAEETGLIDEIGRWVLREACARAAEWPKALTVSVNVSPVQAMSENLVHTAVSALQASALPAGRLELEITESVFLNESHVTMRVLRSLQAAGMRIALDDFGTGYSSLAYLRRFPFDTLKIDHSFVRELMARRDAQAIVKMIVGLARTLHMRIVAEGVEQDDQAAMLYRYGCDALQGAVVASPMPAAQVAAFLDEWHTRPRLDVLPAVVTDSSAGRP